MAKMIKKIPCLPFLSIVLMILFALGSCEDEMHSLKKEDVLIHEETLTRGGDSNSPTQLNPSEIQEEKAQSSFEEAQN